VDKQYIAFFAANHGEGRLGSGSGVQGARLPGGAPVRNFVLPFAHAAQDFHSLTDIQIIADFISRRAAAFDKAVQPKKADGGNGGRRQYRPGRAGAVDRQHGAVIDELGRQIATGRRPADSIMTVAGLEADFGVSRTVVREVVKVLESLGMLRLKRRVGITVQPRSAWHMLDPRVIRWRMSDPRERRAHFLAMNELRRGLEPEAARLAARRGSPSQAARLADLAGRMRSLGGAGRGATREFLQADTDFHELVIAMCGNEIILQLGSLIGSLLVERTHWAMQPDYPDERAMDAHIRMACAIRNHDEEAAWRASSYIVNQADEEIRLGRP